MYKPHDSNPSWEWLAKIAACTDILSVSDPNPYRVVGTSTRRQKDIQEPVISLREHGKNTVGNRCTIVTDKPCVPNIISQEVHNRAAQDLQPCFCVTPEPSHATASGDTLTNINTRSSILSMNGEMGGLRSLIH